MEITEEGDVITTLRQLAFKLKNEIKEGISSGKIQPMEELYIRRKIDEFEYSEDGEIYYEATDEYFPKKNWILSSNKVLEDIKKSNEYSSILELLTKLFKKEKKISSALGRFAQNLAWKFLNDSKLDEKDIESSITTFLKVLKEEPLKYGAKVELDGIIILTPKIEFKVNNTDIVLRKTTITDFEKEFPPSEKNSSNLRRPIAILKIEFPGREVGEIRKKIRQSIAILRLFKVGSVDYISYHKHFEFTTGFPTFKTVNIGRISVLEKSKIKEEDVEKLKKFWQEMAKTLPVSFYEVGETKLDYVTIAYKRYCDALLQNGILERRIANAVMGLESLFLKGGEKHELSYRLRMRIAKIFALLGYDSNKVCKIVKTAYNVRSLFVHGSHLSSRKEREFNNNFGDIGDFLRFLIDYLRISIIIMLSIKMKKEAFIDLVDNALFDKDKDSQINNLLNKAKNAILGL